MPTINTDTFAMVCFLVLMQNGEGIKDKAPGYIEEKLKMLHMGEDAFAMLDIDNMKKVRDYCDFWKVEMPEKCRDYLKDSEDAYAELMRRSVFL